MGDTNYGVVFGTIAAGLAAAVGILYRAWSRLRLGNTSDNTDSQTLRMLSAAVEHWKGLYDTAWEQVKKERQMREEAEARVVSVVEKMELLRDEVATLRREVEALTYQLQHPSTSA